MVFLLDFLLEERRDGLVKPIKTNGWRDWLEKKMDMRNG